MIRLVLFSLVFVLVSVIIFFSSVIHYKEYEEYVYIPFQNGSIAKIHKKSGSTFILSTNGWEKFPIENNNQRDNLK